jgi:hypothetical protein
MDVFEVGRLAPFRIVNPGAAEGLARVREAGQGLAAMFAKVDRDTVRLVAWQRQLDEGCARYARVFRALEGRPR